MFNSFFFRELWKYYKTAVHHSCSEKTVIYYAAMLLSVVATLQTQLHQRHDIA